MTSATARSKVMSGAAKRRGSPLPPIAWTPTALALMCDGLVAMKPVAHQGEREGRKRRRSAY